MFNSGTTFQTKMVGGISFEVRFDGMPAFHCTMLLSIEIGKRIFFKVNGWIFLIFQPNLILLLCTGKKLQIFCEKNYVYTSMMQNIGYFSKKLEGGDCES